MSAMSFWYRNAVTHNNGYDDQIISFGATYVDSANTIIGPHWEWAANRGGNINYGDGLVE